MASPALRQVEDLTRVEKASETSAAAGAPAAAPSPPVSSDARRSNHHTDAPHSLAQDNEELRATLAVAEATAAAATAELLQTRSGLTKLQSSRAMSTHRLAESVAAARSPGPPPPRLRPQLPASRSQQPPLFLTPLWRPSLACPPTPQARREVRLKRRDGLQSALELARTRARNKQARSERPHRARAQGAAALLPPTLSSGGLAARARETPAPHYPTRIRFLPPQLEAETEELALQLESMGLQAEQQRALFNAKARGVGGFCLAAAGS